MYMKLFDLSGKLLTTPTWHCISRLQLKWINNYHLKSNQSEKTSDVLYLGEKGVNTSPTWVHTRSHQTFHKPNTQKRSKLRSILYIVYNLSDLQKIYIKIRTYWSIITMCVAKSETMPNSYSRLKFSSHRSNISTMYATAFLCRYR